MNLAIALFLLFASTPQDIELQASTLTMTASTQLFRGEYGAAAASLQKATALYQKINKPKDEAFAWARLTQVYLALAQYDKASAALKKARTLAGTLDDPGAQAIADSIEAVAKMAAAGPTTAYLWSFDKDLTFDLFWPFFNDLGVVSADPAFITNDFTADRMLTSIPMMAERITLMEGRTLFEAGNFSAAREKWKTVLAQSMSTDVRSGAMAGIGATYLKEKNPSEAIKWFKQAADVTETPLQRIQDPELMTSYLGSERRWYYDITIETLLQNERPEEAFDYSERSRARAFLQMVGNHRVASRSNAEYASLTTVEPLRLEDIRRELPADTTLITYFVSTYGVRAWIVDGNSIHYAALPVDHASLERTVSWATSFRSAGARGFTPVDPGAPKGKPGSAEEAFAVLFAPLQKYVRNRRLIIVPHGVLHYVPFAALRDAKSGRYLVEDYTLTFSPSASTLRFIRAKETPIAGRALVLGDPQTTRGSLPGSAREAAAVARAFGTTAMLGPRATEDLLYRLRGHIDLVHIAAHGKYDPVNPLASQLLLAPGGTRDGKLEVHEILSELDLTGVNLVVLSACETAVGKRGGGDDVVGLTRAILYAGSAGVISTLWDIDDDASALLMEEFYSRLRKGESAADALRGAQLTLLRNKAHTDPRFWAAFTITGDPRGRWTSAAPPSTAEPHRPRNTTTGGRSPRASFP